MGELIFVATGLAVWGWQQRRRRARWAGLTLEQATAAGDWPRVEEIVRQALPYAKGGLPEATLCQLLAQALAAQERHGEAADALDPSLARHLPPRQMASWHNTRGLALALAGRLDEADDELELAEVVVGDDEDVDGRVTYACVVGNRGIIELGRGKLDRAEELVRQAHAMFGEILRTEAKDSPYARLRGEWEAELAWWLAEIASRRGDAELARTRLEEAARLEKTHYGKRAREKLHPPADQPAAR